MVFYKMDRTKSDKKGKDDFYSLFMLCIFGGICIWLLPL